MYVFYVIDDQGYSNAFWLRLEEIDPVLFTIKVGFRIGELFNCGMRNMNAVGVCQS